MDKHKTRAIWVVVSAVLMFGMAAVIVSRHRPTELQFSQRPVRSTGDVVGAVSLAPQTFALTNPQTGHSLPTDVYFKDCSVDRPREIAILLHGFQSRKEQQSGNARALADSGYLVVVPTLTFDLLTPNPAERRQDVVFLMDALLDEAGTIGALVAPCADKDRIALIGHSAGGGTALEVAAVDARVKAVVGLDAVFGGGPAPQSDPAVVALPDVPVLLIQAPAHACNNEANQGYDLATVASNASSAIVEIPLASHCDFMDASVGCALLCGADDAARREDIRLRMRAWLDFALRGDAAARERAIN